MPITRFSGNYRFLSNFHAVDPTVLWGYPTIENFFQAMKTTNVDRRQPFKDCTPGQAKRLGRRLTLRADWEDLKDEVMLAGLRAKFSLPHFQKLLLDTGDEILVEGNVWHDNYWGDCVCTDQPNCQADGKNMLGKLLMQVREEIR